MSQESTEKMDAICGGVNIADRIRLLREEKNRLEDVILEKRRATKKLEEANSELMGKTFPHKAYRALATTTGWLAGMTAGIADRLAYISYDVSLFKPIKDFIGYFVENLPEPLPQLAKIAYVIPIVVGTAIGYAATRPKKVKTETKAKEIISGMSAESVTLETIGLGVPTESKKPEMPATPMPTPQPLPILKAPEQPSVASSVEETPIFCSADVHGKICNDGSNTWLNFRGADYYITNKGIFDADSKPPTDINVLTLYALHQFVQSRQKPQEKS